MAKTFFGKIKQTGIDWLARRLPTCKETVPLMSESMDRNLSLREWISLRLHLWVCSICGRYLKQLRLLGEIARSCDAADTEPSFEYPSLSPDARDRIRQAIENQQSP